jgi:hypothetical protein
MTIAAITTPAVAGLDRAPVAAGRPAPQSDTMPTFTTDTLQTSALRAPGRAAMPVQLETSATGGVDFTKIFEGFQPGGKLKITCSIPLAGGSGTLVAVTPDHIKLSGKVSIVGLVNETLDVELKKQPDGTYRMTGTANQHVSIKQEGKRLTITDLDSPTHKVFFTATKTGTIEVKTVGMGYDAISAKIKAK